jgi:hypothetical protein
MESYDNSISVFIGGSEATATRNLRTVQLKHTLADLRHPVKKTAVCNREPGQSWGNLARRFGGWNVWFLWLSARDHWTAAWQPKVPGIFPEEWTWPHARRSEPNPPNRGV